MLDRALLFCRNESDEKKYEVMEEICSLFAKKFSNEIKTVELASLRNGIIERITKNEDPMREMKEKSFTVAKKLYPKLREYVSKMNDPEERFRKVLMIALAGNIIEFGVKGHEVNLKNLEKEIFSVVEGNLEIDDIDEIYEKVKSAREILYVTDNVAELIFDKIFIEELREEYGVKVFIAPLSRTVQDDAWIEDVKKAKIDAKIIPRGDFIGVWFERCTREFLKKWNDVDFIIAKGMACYETLSEYPEETKGRRVGLLFKVKCKPVARDVGVNLGGVVVKIL
jgi:hypothetical protein